MTRQVLAGIALAIGAALTFALGGLVGTEVHGVALLGLAAGAAIGLVPDATPGRRAAAFALGVLVGWIGFLLRAVALPDAPAGRLVAVVAVVALCAVVAVVGVGRLPMWAALLGAGALAGAYETVYSANPTAFLTTSPQQVTAILLAAAVGFVATVLLEPHTSTAAHRAQDDDTATEPDAETSDGRPDDASSATSYRPLDTVPEA